MIDFEKAFDSISFKYIIKTLKFFKFGLKKLVILLLNNFKASICHAGNISAQFDILRACRQGDPIASILFILCIEIMAVKLRGSNEIKEYKMDNLENLLSLYADDCSIFLEYNATNLRNTITILDSFYAVSGLKIQVTKTQCIIFGIKATRNHILCQDLNMEWKPLF